MMLLSKSYGKQPSKSEIIDEARCDIKLINSVSRWFGLGKGLHLGIHILFES